MPKRPIPPTPTHPEMPFGLERMIFFSDAVMAIAITLLVIDLRLPAVDPAAPADLSQLLARLTPRLIAYTISFTVVGIFWMGHHRMFNEIRAYDRGLLWLNLLFLFLVASIPFPTTLLSDYPGQTLSEQWYAADVAALAAVRGVMWWYATRNHRLTDPHLSPTVIRTETVLIAATVLVFCLSIVVAGFAPGIAMFTWLLVLPVTLLLRAKK